LLESGDSYVNARMRQESCPNLRCRYVWGSAIILAMEYDSG
jgi:hypothetical protein